MDINKNITNNIPQQTMPMQSTSVSGTQTGVVSDKAEIGQSEKPSFGRVFWDELGATVKDFKEAAQDNMLTNTLSGLSGMGTLAVGTGLGILGGAVFLGGIGMGIGPVINSFSNQGVWNVLTHSFGTAGTLARAGMMIGGVTVGAGCLGTATGIFPKIAGALSYIPSVPAGIIKGVAKGIKSATGGDVELHETANSKPKPQTEKPIISGGLAGKAVHLGERLLRGGLGAIGIGAGAVGGFAATAGAKAVMDLVNQGFIQHQLPTFSHLLSSAGAAGLIGAGVVAGVGFYGGAIKLPALAKEGVEKLLESLNKQRQKINLGRRQEQLKEKQAEYNSLLQRSNSINEQKDAIVAGAIKKLDAKEGQIIKLEASVSEQEAQLPAKIKEVADGHLKTRETAVFAEVKRVDDKEKAIPKTVEQNIAANIAPFITQHGSIVKQTKTYESETVRLRNDIPEQGRLAVKFREEAKGLSRQAQQTAAEADNADRRADSEESVVSSLRGERNGLKSQLNDLIEERRREEEEARERAEAARRRAEEAARQAREEEERRRREEEEARYNSYSSSYYSSYDSSYYSSYDSSYYSSYDSSYSSYDSSSGFSNDYGGSSGSSGSGFANDY